ASALAGSNNDAIGGDPSLRAQVDALEARLVSEALRRANGNQTKAALALGLSRFGLQKMLKRLGVQSRSGDDSHA
ncbi:MAG: helix-turn-helix domain-containing protein, partial [Polyangiales bacterium]